MDPRTKYLVVRAIVGRVLTEAFSSRLFLGDASFATLERVIAGQGTFLCSANLNEELGSICTSHADFFPVSTSDLNRWRSQTLVLLSQNRTAIEARSQAVKDITQRIDSLTYMFLENHVDPAGVSALHEIVGIAAALDLDICMQTSEYQLRMEDVGTPFSEPMMEDVLQERNGAALEGMPIQAVIFPAVLRFEHGQSEMQSNRFIVVSKAQVLVG
jgi:hypothetical protein